MHPEGSVEFIYPFCTQGELEEDILEKQGFPRIPFFALAGMAFVGVVACCYVLIMMGTALMSIGSIASAYPQGDVDSIALYQNLPGGCDTTLDLTLFEGIEGDPVSYEWYGPFPPATTPNPDVFMPEGTHAVSLLTYDGQKRSQPYTAYIRVEPAFTFNVQSKRGRVVLDLPRRADTNRYVVFRAPSGDPTAFRKIAEVGPGAGQYADTAVGDATYLYAVATVSDGQWLYSGIRAAHPYTILPGWNYAPVICSEPVTNAQVGLPYTYDVLAADVNDENLTYSLASPHEGMTIDPKTGLIEWLPRMAGDYETTVRVSDRKGYSSSQTFVIEVDDLSDPNRNPLANAGGPYAVEAGEELVLSGSGSYDPDGARLQYAWDFGDGTQENGVMPVHVYANPGTYQAILTVTDGRGGIASASTTVTVQKCLAPRVTLAADPAAVQPGAPCSLVWKSQKADTLVMDHGIGSVEESGTIMVYPDKTTTVTMTASGRCGTTTVSTTIMVHEKPVADISASIPSIRTGETSTLKWSCTNADTVTLDQGIGSVLPGGTMTVSPRKTTRYTITARGPGGTASGAVTVEVMPAVTADIRASQEWISPGEAVILTWTTEHASRVSIDHGIGEVTEQGTLMVLPQTATAYTISAAGPLGTVTDTVTVNVHPPPTVTMMAEPSKIEQGRAAVVSWTSANADSAFLDTGIGEVETNGSLSLAPAETTTYTMNVMGKGGSASARVTVEVIHEPEVSLTASPAIIQEGGRCTLTWESRNAVSAFIDQGIGPVPSNGSVEVQPSATTTYTITGKGANGQSVSGIVTVQVLQLQQEASPDPPSVLGDRPPP